MRHVGVGDQRMIFTSDAVNIANAPPSSEVHHRALLTEFCGCASNPVVIDDALDKMAWRNRVSVPCLGIGSPVL
jgi:hypothetical protein